MTLQSQGTSICICGGVDCSVPFGLCHCGCGTRTSVSSQNYSGRGYVKGQPKIYVLGHAARQRKHTFIETIMDGALCLIVSLTKGQATVVDFSERWRFEQSLYGAVGPNRVGAYYAAHRFYYSGRTRFEYLHREILGLAPDDSRMADHIAPSSTLDNRRINLRPVTKEQNQWNKRTRGDSATGLKGAYPKAGGTGFWSHITVNGVFHYLGEFPTAFDAHIAYCEASRRLHGEYANYESLLQ